MQFAPGYIDSFAGSDTLVGCNLGLLCDVAVVVEAASAFMISVSGLHVFDNRMEPATLIPVDWHAVTGLVLNLTFCESAIYNGVED